ncbi:DUF3987 domain-containing protein [Burkholderia sp. MBR-1]|uniref:DUF3987 domain-containing protein n=2 Tax=Burkholderia TaxID=32008 RepID=UPI0015EF2413|nr:DUF3987 domain-containing protein [Burkholderia sp. MBR-1]QMI43985.1 DUF3987 domain-containing protein [Burkholderia sp. MBR-1]
MNASAYAGGGIMPLPFQQGFFPQYLRVPQSGSSAPSIWQAIQALTPGLYRAACECHAIHGAGYGAILANTLGKVSFAASGNARIRDRSGRATPLSLHIQFAGARLSGKSAAHDRLNAPIVEAMKGWEKRWLFDNVRPPTLLRKIRAGSVLTMFSMPEGRGYLAGPLSRSFQDLSDLYDSNVPSFDRADDDDDALVEHAVDSAIFVTCVNVQDDAHRKWLDRYAQDAMASGYLFRLLMIETDELAIEGAGGQQPEYALLDYDQRIVELIASARHKLQSMSASQLPEIEVESGAEQILRQAQGRFRFMASAVLSPRDATVFVVRLVANARRIAGCMHVFERYPGPVLPDTMTRAVTIAEYFGASWLATVFPPKAPPEEVLRGQRLLDVLCNQARQSGMQSLSWREADIVALAPNFGWSRAQMKSAITSICGAGFAQVVPRIEHGRRVIKLELIMPQAGYLPGGYGDLTDLV